MRTKIVNFFSALAIFAVFIFLYGVAG